MPTQSFLRLSGWLLLVGGIIFALDTILSFFIPGPLGPSGPPPVWLAWLGALGAILLVIGLPAAYKLHERSVRTLSLIGVIALMVALLLLGVISNVIPAIAFTNFVPPTTAPQGPPTPPTEVIVIFIAGSVLLIAGAITFGIAMLRARIFPAWLAWTLMITAILSVIGLAQTPVLELISTIATALFTLVLTWIGYELALRDIARPAIGDAQRPLTTS